MKRLIILTLGISLMAVACNKPTAVIDTPSTTAKVESNEVAQTPVQSDTPTTQQSVTPPTPTISGKIKVADLIIPKTNEERDFQIDQSTLKNIEQDGRLDKLETQPVVVPTPTPVPVPQPTPIPQGDITPPSVSITSPVSGEKVSGNAVLLSASASDDVGIVGVRFMIDGVNIGQEDTKAPYSVVWDSADVSSPHTLKAVARDEAGNTTTSAIIPIISLWTTCHDHNATNFGEPLPCILP